MCRKRPQCTSVHLKHLTFSKSRPAWFRFYPATLDSSLRISCSFLVDFSYLTTRKLLGNYYETTRKPLVSMVVAGAKKSALSDSKKRQKKEANSNFVKGTKRGRCYSEEGSCKMLSQKLQRKIHAFGYGS